MAYVAVIRQGAGRIVLRLQLPLIAANRQGSYISRLFCDKPPRLTNTEYIPPKTHLGVQVLNVLLISTSFCLFVFLIYLQRCSEILELSQNTFLMQSVLPTDGCCEDLEVSAFNAEFVFQSFACPNRKTHLSQLQVETNPLKKTYM